jgi:hypothetical protein
MNMSLRTGSSCCLAIAVAASLLAVPARANQAVPAFRAPVYRARPVYRAPVVSHPVVSRPVVGHPVVGRPIVGGHPVVGQHLIQGPHRHDVHHGMHGHFDHGHWIINPDDPPYVGDDYDNSGDDQSNSNAVSNPGANNYGAAAAAAYTDSDGNGFAASGVATAADPHTADSLAIQLCENQGGGGNCTVVGRFRSGCGYVSVGALGNDQLPIGNFSAWGYGATPQVAFAQCAQRLVGCKTPAGACIAQ